MRGFLALLLVCFITTPFPALAAPGDKGGTAPPPLVMVSKIDLGNANQPEKFVGHVQAISSIKLRARVEGYVQKVNFQEGSVVQEGELLYVIEQAPYTAQVDAAKARVMQD